jgi:hypothetical protein
MEKEIKKFLGFEEFTRPSDNLRKLAKILSGRTQQETINNILFWIEKNIKPIDLERKDHEKWRETFGKRKVTQIFKERTAYGCGNYTQLFVTLARLCGIPAKFVHGKRIWESGTHVWARVFIKGRWIDIDPSQGAKGWDFNPAKAIHGPYRIISESVGPSDSAVPSYQAWKDLEKRWDYTKGDFK